MYYLSGNVPAYLTIVARGEHGGYMEHSDTESIKVMTKEDMLGRIRTSLGGRAAEIAYYGDKEGISSTASGDLRSATNIARTMICSYGMDETIGMVALTQEDSQKGPYAGRITERISEIIKEELGGAVRAISEGRETVDLLVAELLDKNKLTSEEISAVFMSPGIMG